MQLAAHAQRGEGTEDAGAACNEDDILGGDEETAVRQKKPQQAEYIVPYSEPRTDDAGKSEQPELLTDGKIGLRHIEEHHRKSLPRAERGCLRCSSPYISERISPDIVISPVSMLIESM